MTKDAANTADTYPYPSDEDLARMLARHRKEQMRERRQSHSWMAWLLDVAPVDIYPSHRYRRSSHQDARREWLRAHTSWSFLGRFQTSFGLKLATGVPIAAALIQAVPELRGQLPMEAFGWLYLAGLTWLAGLLLYQLACPKLLKAANGSYAGLTGAPRRALLAAYVGAELADLAGPREWKLDVARLEPPGAEYEAAMGLVALGYTPAFRGYGPWAQALIERALYEWAEQQQVQVLEESKGTLQLRSQRLRIYEGGLKPCVHHLRLTSPSSGSVEKQPQFKPSDLVVDWIPAPLQGMEEEPDGHPSFVEGLAALFVRDASAEAFARIVAQWCNWRRPAARFPLLLLYAATAVLLAVFLSKQTFAVIAAM